MTHTRKASFPAAVVVFLFLILCVIFMTVQLKTSPHIPLLISTVIAALTGKAFGFSWKEMQEGILSTIRAALPAILIIMVIGILIGSWIIGGIIPTMIDYGLRLISPSFFLVTALLLCSVVSLAVGSSLSTIGTVGVALFGIGSAMGVPAAMTVGAIVSGAYFGDKMSPLSDTTNLAPSVSGADIFDHIRCMMGTTVPTYIICVVIYGILGFTLPVSSGSEESVSVISGALHASFTIHPLLLIPPVLVILMVVFRVPALPGLLAAAVLGLLCGGLVQGYDLSSLLGTIMDGYTASTGVEAVDTLLNRGGMMGMMKTIALMLIALSFAGIFESTGMAQVLAEKILSRVHSDKGLVIATVLTAWGILLGTGQQYVAIIMTGRLYRDEYARRNLRPQYLSRSLEDSGTVFGGIVPYSTGAGFTESALGISAWQYGPFTFFGWINPLVAIAIAAWKGPKKNSDSGQNSSAKQEG